MLREILLENRVCLCPAFMLRPSRNQACSVVYEKSNFNQRTIPHVHFGHDIWFVVSMDDLIVSERVIGQPPAFAVQRINGFGDRIVASEKQD